MKINFFFPIDRLLVVSQPTEMAQVVLEGRMNFIITRRPRLLSALQNCINRLRAASPPEVMVHTYC